MTAGKVVSAELGDLCAWEAEGGIWRAGIVYSVDSIAVYIMPWALFFAWSGWPIAAHALLFATLLLYAWREWRLIAARRCACCLSEGHAVLYRVPLPGRRVDARCADCAAAGRVAA